MSHNRLPMEQKMKKKKGKKKKKGCNKDYYGMSVSDLKQSI